MMARSLRLDQLAAVCGRPDVAVLLPDACALLDIVRLPIRCGAAQIRRELAAVDRVIEAATCATPRLAIFIAPPIANEWAENIEKVLGETDKATKQWFERGDAFAEVHGRSTYSPNVKACASFLATGASLRARAESILACAIEMDRDDTAMARAMHRVSLAQAPAKKGGQAKDCMIIEHVLAAARVCGATPTQATVFLSSNTTDYCEAGTTTLRRPLFAEFPQARLQFATQWAWAQSLLGI